MLLKTFLIASAIVLANNPLSVHAFFRMLCSQPLVAERSDPIVNPGAVSGHLHSIMGGNAFNFSMTYDQTQAASCSSCKAKKDNSNYWAPHLMYQAQNGSFHKVSQVGGALIYYLQRTSPSNPSETLYPFPPGFRMVAGDPFLRSYDPNSLAQRAISFVCLDYSNPAPPQQPSIFNQNCKDGLRSQVFFPSCWDGVNLDSADHKSHVAYPSNEDAGECSPTHPKRLVSLFYEIIWDVNAWKDMWWKEDGSHPFVFAMGDPTGYGYHGDFLNGWDQDALETAIKGCTQDTGVIEDCGAALELRSDDEMDSCSRASYVKEDNDGWLDKLPGCNAVQDGPARAVVSTSCGAVTPGTDVPPSSGGGNSTQPSTTVPSTSGTVPTTVASTSPSSSHTCKKKRSRSTKSKRTPSPAPVPIPIPAPAPAPVPVELDSIPQVEKRHSAMHSLHKKARDFYQRHH